jgi:hypothetical protein
MVTKNGRVMVQEFGNILMLTYFKLKGPWIDYRSRPFPVIDPAAL